MNPDQILSSLFQVGLGAVDPYQAVIDAIQLSDDTLTIQGHVYNLKQYQRILILGAGKATAAMAEALEHCLGARISDGMIVVKYQHTRPLHYIQQYQAAHPIPDQAGLLATEQLLQQYQNLDSTTLVVVLLSGGASALWVSPIAGISFADKQLATRLLLNAGANIQELNAVRQRLSRIKAGGLAQHLAPATVVVLVVSDVLGDKLDVIGSAPCYYTEHSADAVCPLIEKYQLAEQLPNNVIQQLKLPAVILPNAIVPKHFVVANLKQALTTIQQDLSRQGIQNTLFSAELQGEARVVAVELAKQARLYQSKLAPGQRYCLLAGGETTVSVIGQGLGGRNQELALSFAIAIAGQQGITLWSAGTDGSDGPTDATGAWVDGATIALAKKHGLNAQYFLEDNDSYHFFQQLDQLAASQHHIKLGPTGTNVMDIQLIFLQGI